MLPLSLSLIFLSTIIIIIPPSFAHPADLVERNPDTTTPAAAASRNQSLSFPSPSSSSQQNAVIAAVQKCGTTGPSDALRQAHADFRAGQKMMMMKGKERRANSPIVVQTYVHFVSTVDQSHYYPPAVRSAMIASQIAIMTSLYRPASISFHLASSSYTVNDAWATDASSTLMKRSLRRGNYGSLNIYFQTNLSTAPATTGGGGGSATLLGYCTLPTSVTYMVPGGEGGEVVGEYPAVDFATDGCNVLAGSMPHAPVPVGGYDLGKTAVHEVGHWFGLLHTFQDNTCALNDPGDYVDDTPQQSQSTTGCPVGKDSCPGSPGVDAISNYMDYSTDACYARFSPDQLVRMRNMFGLFRQGY